MPGWLSRNNFYPSDYVHASDLNNLANDNITWGGDVNGGGYHLSNVILQGSGGFSSYVSPIEVTPGSTGTTCLQLDQTVGANHVARWTVCKDATAETGSNTGSNFAVGRYTDAGVVIDTPIAINRATGLITMGAQQWAGAVNGGGNSISNVVLSGVTISGYVPTTTQVIAGPGLAGGGPLSANVTLSAPVMGASGASHAAGLVPDPGATAGSTRYLREDGAFTVPPGAGGGTANYWVNGALVGTQPTLNLIGGTNVTIGGANNTGANRVDITITASGTGGTGSPQTPWAQNIDGSGFTLTNVSQIGIGTPPGSAHFPLHVASGGPQLALGVDSNPTYNLQFTYATAGAAIQNIANGASAPLLLNPGGGNVGINCTSSAAILEVDATFAQTPAIYANNPLATWGSAAAFNAYRFFYTASAATDGAFKAIHLGAAGIGIGYTPPPYGAPDALSVNGRVGIGTQTALMHCHVNGALLVTAPGFSITSPNSGSMDSDGSGNMRFISYGPNTSTLGAFQFIQVHSDNSGAIVPIVISTNGFVGIRTSAPQYALDVSGAIRASQPFITPADSGYEWWIGSFTAVGPWQITRRNISNASIITPFTISTSGYVGVGSNAPQFLFSVIAAANPAAPAQAQQIVVGESSNNPGYRVQLGYYFDAADSFYKGALAAFNNNVGAPLLLNANGGPIIVGAASPRPNSILSLIGPNPTSNATARQLTIGESTNNGTYGLSFGYWPSTAVGWAGVIQVLAGGGGYPLLLNPSGGYIGLNMSTPGYALDVVGDVNCTGAFRVNGTAIGGGGIAGVGWLASGVGVSTRPNCNFTAGGTIGFSVTDVPGSNRVDVFYSVGSDVRLKRNLVPLTGGLDLINRLRPYEFEYNGLGGREEGRRAVSILAQDLQAIYPQGVTSYPAKLRPEDAETTDLLTFDTLDILFHAALAIQQLSARIETLEKLLKGN